MIVPEFLTPGSKIAIVSPSGRVKAEYVTDTAELLESYGLDPYISPHALGESGTFSGTADERYSDLEAALLDPDVKAILCSRGGYGAVHLLERLDKLPLCDNPKWIIGFSDISALHALMHSKGIMSVHASMTSHIAKYGLDDPDTSALLSILRGDIPAVSFNSSPLNHPGVAEAPMCGGNLAVIMGLLDTPYDIIRPDTILFVEDISEPVYKVERQFYQLYLSGVLSRLKGLVIGQFTDYSQDVNHCSMEDMIAGIVDRYDYPVAFNAPIGHVDHNIPVVEGAITRLTVTPLEVTIEQSFS